MASSSRDEIKFAVLGPVIASRGDTELHLHNPQQRAFLALLVLRAGRPVSLDEAIAVLWPQDPPASAINMINRHVGQIRHLLEPELASRVQGQWLERGSGGFLLRTDASSSDLLQFRALVQSAREAQAVGDIATAATRFHTALSLWNGSAVAGIPAESRAHPVFVALDHEHLAVLLEAADVACQCGRGDLVVELLQSSARRHPLDEALHAWLIRALASSGQQAAALDTFRLMHKRLADELGVTPGAELRAAHQHVLAGNQPGFSGDPVSDSEPAFWEQAPDLPVTAAGPVSPRPAQLPSDLAVFAGRDADLERLNTLLPERDVPPGVALISAVNGMGGVGKTTLAVHWAHQLADRFPDGQLFVNLRGFESSGSAMDPAEALRGFLAALGTAPRDLPKDLDAQAALYRSLLSDRRMLILLDNARDAEQVRPLLPGGSGGSLVIVTSRNRLSGLVATSGAQPTAVDLLPAEAAFAVLARRLGPARLTAEPEATAQIIEACAGLPLALAIVAARAAAHPDFPLRTMAEQLQQAQGSLDAFADQGAGSDLRGVFSWSYHALSPEAADLFRLLALHPGPEVSVAAAAALLGLPVRRVRVRLNELAHAHLLLEPLPGRFTWPDLLRAYAGELTLELDPQSERRAARHRLLDHYLHSAFAAARLLDPHRNPITLSPPVPGVTIEDPGTVGPARTWLLTEIPVLSGISALAGEEGFDAHAWQVAWCLQIIHAWLGQWHEQLTVQKVALAAASRLADPEAQAVVHRCLGDACGRLEMYDEAVENFNHSLRLYRGQGNLVGQAHTENAIALAMERQGRFVEAIEHTQQAMDHLREANHLPGQGRNLNTLGWLHARLGHYEEAIDACEEGLALLIAIDDRHGEADALDSLAYIHHETGNYTKALIRYTEAAERYRGLGHRYGEAETLVSRGETQLALNDVDGTRRTWNTALGILLALDHPDADPLRSRINELGEHRS